MEDIRIAGFCRRVSYIECKLDSDCSEVWSSSKIVALVFYSHWGGAI